MDEITGWVWVSGVASVYLGALSWLAWRSADRLAEEFARLPGPKLPPPVCEGRSGTGWRCAEIEPPRSKRRPLVD